MDEHGILAGLLALAVVGAASVGCESSGPQPPEPVPVEVAPGPPPLDVFSGERAFQDLLALGEEGRAEGGDPRAVLERTLAPLGLEVRPVVTGEGREAEGVAALPHLMATLPGTSPDLFVLVAPYDGGGDPGPPPLAGNAGASGAALLLELARVLSTRTNPYTLRFVFVAGDRSALSGPDVPERWRGSRELAARMEERGELERTRLLVAFDAVCGAGLRVVRDLGSHRVYREEFFKAAQRVGKQGAFPAGQPFEQAQASHVAFTDRGLRASVAIVGADEPAEGDPPPGCVPASLEAVGWVALEALETIGARLAKIDRFARSPLSELAPPPLAPLPAQAADGPMGASE